MKNFLNNPNFKNSNNYIFSKKQAGEIFFLFSYYNRKKFLDDYLNSKTFYYISIVLSGIFPISIFFSIFQRKYNIFVKYYIFLFLYFLFSFLFYKYFFAKKRKNKKIYIYKINPKKIFLQNYFFNKKITYSLKKEILDLINKNYYFVEK